MPTTINGTGITFPNGTTQTTAASGAGTVTSVATGNGLQGGTITTSGTLSVACPTQNTVGSYASAGCSNTNYCSFSFGSNYATGSGVNQLRSAVLITEGCGWGITAESNISGTWKWLGASFGTRYYALGLACRVS